MITENMLSILESDSEPEKKSPTWTGITKLEPVAVPVESDDEFVFDEPEHAEYTFRDISFQDLKTEVSTFIQQLPTPLIVEEFREQYITHGSWPIKELDLDKWGWFSYSVMIMEFAKTEDFEIVQALKVKKDYSPDRSIWLFALDPNNLEHWRYFFENGFVKFQKIYTGAAKVQQQTKSSTPQPSVPFDSSTQLDEAQFRARYGVGICWAFQRQMCDLETCRRPHRCSSCNSMDHGAEACPIISSSTDMIELQIKRETLNNTKKSIFNENLTPLELAEMLGAVNNDALAKGKCSRRKLKSLMKKSMCKKGNCFDFHKGLCNRGRKCIYRHQCSSCGAHDHGGSICPWNNKSVVAKRARKFRRKRNQLAKKKGLFPVAQVQRGSRRNPRPKSGGRTSRVSVKQEFVPMFPKLEVPPALSKSGSSVVQKTLTNSYDALPSANIGADYDRTPLSEGYKKGTERGRAVTRIHPY